MQALILLYGAKQNKIATYTKLKITKMGITSETLFTDIFFNFCEYVVLIMRTCLNKNCNFKFISVEQNVNV